MALYKFKSNVSDLLFDNCCNYRKRSFTTQIIVSYAQQKFRQDVISTKEGRNGKRIRSFNEQRTPVPAEDTYSPVCILQTTSADGSVHAVVANYKPLGRLAVHGAASRPAVQLHTQRPHWHCRHLQRSTARIACNPHAECRLHTSIHTRSQQES